MSIINQPFQGQLGDIIISALKNGYTDFTIFSAFAKNHGKRSHSLVRNWFKQSDRRRSLDKL